MLKKKKKKRPIGIFLKKKKKLANYRRNCRFLKIWKNILKILGQLTLFYGLVIEMWNNSNFFMSLEFFYYKNLSSFFWLPKLAPTSYYWNVPPCQGSKYLSQNIKQFRFLRKHVDNLGKFRTWTEKCTRYVDSALNMLLVLNMLGFWIFLSRKIRKNFFNKI